MLRSLVKRFILNSAKNVNKLNKQKWLQPPKKYLHICSGMNAKAFVDHENMYAHQVLEHSSKHYHIIPKYNDIEPTHNISPTILQPSEENVTINQFFDNFKVICSYCQHTNSLISQTRFTDFVKLYCDKIHLLNDDQLKDSLRLLAILPKEETVRSPNFLQLWNSLDIECCRRHDQWKTDELLLVCDAWYQLNLARICDFVWLSLRKLGRKVIKMEPNQLVQTMFFCNVMRRSVFDMFDFEVNLAKCATEMSLTELAVMSMGFFKTQTPIRNKKLVGYLYQRLMDELNMVDDITLVAILKVLRYSSKLSETDIMMQLLDKIYKEKLNDINILTCLHVALLGCELQLSHDGIIEKIIQKFDAHIDTIRLKDMERIILVIALFNIHSPSKSEELLCENVIISLRERMDEIIKYPKCFLNCLHFLSLRGHYDKEMLSSALDRKFLKHAVGSSLPMSRVIFHLDTFVKVNLLEKGYEGPQIPDNNRKVMGKMLTQYIPERNSKFKLNKTDTILLQVKEYVDEFLPHSQIKHILPNYDRPDIIVCYDREQRKSIDISKDCPENYSGVILTRDLLLGPNNRNDVVTIAIVIAGWNSVVKGKDRHTGLFDMKLKQLELLGHKYVLTYWYEWDDQETHKDRVNMMKRNLSKIIKL